MEYHFYENNITEGDQCLVARNPNNKLDILGTTRILDGTDYYVCVYVNGIMKDGCLNEDPHINRISLLMPKYLTCYRPFTKEELEWVNNAMHEHWERVIHNLDWIYNGIYGMSIEIPDIHCPDYSVLETVD